MNRVKKILRWLAPFVITTAALVWVFQGIDFGSVAARLTPTALGTMIPALLAFGAVALWIEAECLVLLLPASREVFDRGTAARIKAASYAVGMLNYALGVAALSVRGDAPATRDRSWRCRGRRDASRSRRGRDVP